MGVVDSLTLDDVALSDDDDVHPFPFSSYNASEAHKKTRVKRNLIQAEFCWPRIIARNGKKQKEQQKRRRE